MFVIKLEQLVESSLFLHLSFPTLINYGTQSETIEAS
jgi:hypothetical protein